MLRMLSKKILMIVCLVLLLAGRAGADAGILNVTVTSPWLAILVNFIGGVNVRVTSIQDWNDDGELVRRIRARNLQSLPADSLIMAFDNSDSKILGLPFEQYNNYRVLYNQMPLDDNKLDAYMSDPSVIPFIAQRVLTVLAGWDSPSYPYYQRRLAEFQARLYSTTLAGRQVLKGQRIYDLTGHSGAFLQAVGCRLTRPSNEDWAEWSAWKEIGRLTGMVSRMAEEKMVVVMDHSTPKAIRSILGSNPAVFMITRPRSNQDYPAFLHDQYISLWSRTTLRPLLPAGRRQ
ncbi:MAG: hypothetical protein FWG71_00260 [Synergistaceae bacterium]|nr:hypothetical protein [Synergistaceae bacterium]